MDIFGFWMKVHKLWLYVTKSSLNWPACRQFTFMDFFSICLLKLKFVVKIMTTIISTLSSDSSNNYWRFFRIFSVRMVNLCAFFLPTSDLSKRDPLQEFQQITGACCLLLPFLISRSSEGGFFKEITSHFTSQAEQKVPSNKQLLLTACGRSWQHCWTLGSSTGLQKTPPAAAAAAASELTRHHSDISSNQSCRREDKMFHNNHGVCVFFPLWMKAYVKNSVGRAVMNKQEVTPKPPTTGDFSFFFDHVILNSFCLLVLFCQVQNEHSSSSGLTDLVKYFLEEVVAG